MTEESKDLATEAVIAAVHGEKEELLQLQHCLIQEEVKVRKQLERSNLAAIKADEAEVRAEVLQLVPESEEGGHDDPERRKERHALEREQLALSREERTEQRAYWTDVQPLTKEDRDIHKALLTQEQRKKRIDELM